MVRVRLVVVPLAKTERIFGLDGPVLFSLNFKSAFIRHSMPSARQLAQKTTVYFLAAL